MVNLIPCRMTNIHNMKYLFGQLPLIPTLF